MHKEHDGPSTAASWPASTSGRGAMNPRWSLITRLRATTIALLTAVLVLGTAAPPAHAVDPGTVVAAAKTAYDTYQKFSGGQMTLEQATALIVSAINQAKIEIITHIDI